MNVTPTSVLDLQVGVQVTLDGSENVLTVVKVGRGMKQRNVTYRRADGAEFAMTHLAHTLVDVVTEEVNALVSIGHGEYLLAGEGVTVEDVYDPYRETNDCAYPDTDEQAAMLWTMQTGLPITFAPEADLTWERVVRVRGSRDAVLAALDALVDDLSRIPSGDDDVFDYWPSGVRLAQAVDTATGGLRAELLREVVRRTLEDESIAPFALEIGMKVGVEVPAYVVQVDEMSGGVATRGDALRAVWAALDATPYATIRVTAPDGSLMYDADLHDSCTTHGLVFSKEGPCPSCSLAAAPTATIYVATAYDACGSYDITAVGADPVQARNLCQKAVRKARRTSGLDPWPYMDDIDVQPMSVGKAYYDGGRAGEVSL